MYIDSKCIGCGNAVPYVRGVACGFCNRVVECSNESRPQVKEKNNSDLGFIQISCREVNIPENYSPALDPKSDSEMMAKPLELAEGIEYSVGDPLLNYRIKAEKKRLKKNRQAGGRALRNIPRIEGNIIKLEQENQGVKQRINFVKLEQIQSARGDIQKIKLLFKGSSAECIRLFVKAVETDDAVSQMQLAWAFDLICKKKNYNPFSKEFSPIIQALKVAFPEKDDRVVFREKKAQIIKKAAECGYLPAIFEQICQEWEMFGKDYGFANQLAPHVGKGHELLDYCFGMALKNNSIKGSKPYYVGMYWMECSLGITVKCAGPNESLDSFFRSGASIETWNLDDLKYQLDGFFHLSDETILAPSEEDWFNFKTQKLLNAKNDDPISYTLPYEMDEIAGIMERFDIRIVQKEAGGKDFDQRDVSGIILYESDEQIGEISISLKTLEIFDSIEDDSEIQPLVNFIKDAMTKRVSATSICSWLDKVSRAPLAKLDL